MQRRPPPHGQKTHRAQHQHVANIPSVPVPCCLPPCTLLWLTRCLLQEPIGQDHQHHPCLPVPPDSPTLPCNTSSRGTKAASSGRELSPSVGWPEGEKQGLRCHRYRKQKTQACMTCILRPASGSSKPSHSIMALCGGQGWGRGGGVVVRSWAAAGSGKQRCGGEQRQVHVQLRG